MILPTDIDTLDNFKRQSKREIQKLKRTGRPKVLTVNGKPAVVVQDAVAYEEFLQQIEEADVVAAVTEGHADFEAGRSMELNKFVAQLRRELLPRRK